MTTKELKKVRRFLKNFSAKHKSLTWTPINYPEYVGCQPILSLIPRFVKMRSKPGQNYGLSREIMVDVDAAIKYMQLNERLDPEGMRKIIREERIYARKKEYKQDVVEAKQVETHKDLLKEFVALKRRYEAEEDIRKQEKIERLQQRLLDKLDRYDRNGIQIWEV